MKKFMQILMTATLMGFTVHAADAVVPQETKPAVTADSAKSDVAGAKNEGKKSEKAVVAKRKGKHSKKQ